ncbi:hypothetical protein [Brevibacillus sp. NRS-1366]|uniref:hypothetical protein n=1 Tax=Brevibacillus sp. NRS-1366 TaxID=3233899 RepID=UPI003D228C34
MNIPLSVVKSNNTDEYVQLKSGLDKTMGERHEKYRAMTNIRESIHFLLKRSHPLDRAFKHQEDYKNNPWIEALEIEELSKQLVKEAGQYQEAVAKYENLNRKIKEMEKI